MVDTISLRERAKQLRKLADTLDEAAAGLESIGGQPSFSGELTATHRRRSSSTIEHASSRDLCYSVLREAGQPMNRGQIMERLRESNRSVTEGTLLSYLSRDKRLMSLGRGVWTLRPGSPQPMMVPPPNTANGGK